MNTLSKIPLYKPQNTVGEEILEDILNEIRQVLRSGWLTTGPQTDKFERAFSKYIGCKYGVATSSCTSALYLALDSLRREKNERVVVPILTFVATAEVVRWAGTDPVFCDVAEDGEIDPAELETLLEKDDRIKGIIPVHLYGNPCDIRKIDYLAKDHGLWMIEDCAQSHGATVNNKKVGSFGNVGCFSFYATKNITTGEGGMIVTNQKEIRDRTFAFRNHCQTRTPKQKKVSWKYDVTDLGFNFRMSEVEAAMGLKQLEKINSINQSRRQIARRYKEELEKIEGIEMLHDPDIQSGSVFHLLVVKVEKSYPLTRNQLFFHLKKKGISSGVHYPPLHYFSYYKRTTNHKKGDFPCAEKLYSKIITLPMFPYMTEQEFQEIIRALRANI